MGGVPSVPNGAPPSSFPGEVSVPRSVGHPHTVVLLSVPLAPSGALACRRRLVRCRNGIGLGLLGFGRCLIIGPEASAPRVHRGLSWYARCDVVSASPNEGSDCMLLLLNNNCCCEISAPLTTFRLVKTSFSGLKTSKTAEKH